MHRLEQLSSCSCSDARFSGAFAAAAGQRHQRGRWRASTATELRDSGEWMAGRAVAGASCASTAIAKGRRCRWRRPRHLFCHTTPLRARTIHPVHGRIESSHFDLEFRANRFEFAGSEHTIVISAKFPIRWHRLHCFDVKMKNLDFYHRRDPPHAAEQLMSTSNWVRMLLWLPSSQRSA